MPSASRVRPSLVFRLIYETVNSEFITQEMVADLDDMLAQRLRSERLKNVLDE